MLKRLYKMSMHAEWNISLWQALFGTGGLLVSFVIPAWAVSSVQAFNNYAPASWVAAGFVGMLMFSAAYALVGIGRSRWVRARYDRNMLSKGPYADPMAKTYEDMRIYLNDFCLPSHTLIENKTFVNCQLIGPANIILQYGNNIKDAAYPISDAVLLKEDANLFNAIYVRNCVFIRCSFQRVTFLVPPHEYTFAKDWHGFNWITHDDNLGSKESNDLNLLPPSTEVEKQP
jgi:hypothetical protein